jgi:putative hydrolase of the HAD superfamily
VIHGVTFDLWDTLVVDDSDEVARARMGLPTKKVARELAFADDVLRHHAVERAAAVAAWGEATAWFQQQWKVEHRTPPVAARVDHALTRLGLGRTPGFDALVHELSTMEVEIPPDLVPGIKEALAELHGRWPLGIVSDAIVTPGWGLRELLRRYDLLRFFDHLVFSDAVGASKPAPAVFHAAAAGLGVPVTGLVHVGDREANDVAGPRAVGARAILITAAVDRGSDHTAADAVCRDAAELFDILTELESE